WGFRFFSGAGMVFLWGDDPALLSKSLQSALYHSQHKGSSAPTFLALRWAMRIDAVCACRADPTTS
ncbi:hypothetical protein N9L70_09815, partial [Rhodobacteraceae bacterium]|nr:hypothetical protein [Paracoccaceae bacterium]